MWEREQRREKAVRPRIANESERSSLTNYKESTQEASKSQGDGKLRPWRTIALELAIEEDAVCLVKLSEELLAAMAEQEPGLARAKQNPMAGASQKKIEQA